MEAGPASASKAPATIVCNRLVFISTVPPCDIKPRLIEFLFNLRCYPLMNQAPAFRHVPQLDGVRAIAVLLVMASHAGLEGKVPGGFGVTIFFFLSGYLITSLLRM